MNRLAALCSNLLRGISVLSAKCGILLALLLGRVSWQAPPWVSFLAAKAGHGTAWLRAHRRLAVRVGLGVVLVAAAAGAAWYWYSSLPKPKVITYHVTDPPRTPLEIDNPRPARLEVKFSASAAPLDKIGKEVTSGIVLAPAFEGRWVWAADKLLVFDPKSDWPVGQAFTVSVARVGVLAESVRLDKYDFTFNTAPFGMTLRSSEFSQDPVDPNLKKVILSLSFSHPVDPAEFERRLVLRLEGQSVGVLGIGAQSTPFTVTYDKKKLNAFIHSGSLAIPSKDTYLEARIDAGVRSTRGGPATTVPLAEKVAIPGLFSLRVGSARAVLVNNERYEPEQVLTLDTSSMVHEGDMQKNIVAYLLPVHNPETPAHDRTRPHRWFDTRRIGEDLLKQSPPLTLHPIPAEREYTTAHSFKFTADVGRFIFLKVNKGLKSWGGYLLGDTFDQIIEVPPFPKEIRILHSGSLLSLSGERKVPILARDVHAVQYEIGRVLPGQIQHLVSQSYGDFGNPEFSSRFGFENLSERFTKVVELPTLAPGKAQYHAFDLSGYLMDSNEGRRGLFLVKVQAYDLTNRTATGRADSRLILVTDLGLLVKQAVDGSQDLFVQSIHSGAPMAAATVQVIGKNGLPALSADTDGAGHARLPSLKSFTREQTPTLYLVKKGSDMSFLPLQRGDRVLDVSRFDVGGVSSSLQADKLQAYLFSDRGIYRPGEQFTVGIIVKAADWSTKLQGVPLELVITDARGLTVKRETVRLPASGFLETRHATEDTSPTGNYNVNLHIIKDDHLGNLIGSLTVKVQDFQPDRLKMNARFSSEAVEGWVPPEGLKARVNLQNLFGTPATQRRVRAQMTLSPAYPAFPSFREFTFYDPQRAKESFQERLSETSTDDHGEAEFDLGLQRFERATYRVHFAAQGFEAEGGRAVGAERTVLVSSMPYLVGFKADGDLRYVNKDAKRSVALIAVNPRAKTIAADRLTLWHVERRFVSVLIKQQSGAYKYESKRKEVRLFDKPLTIPPAGLHLPLPTVQPGDYALIIRDAQGQELNRVEYSVAGRANLTRSLEKNAELQIRLSRSDVAPGQEIQLQIRAPYTGSGLIAIEREKVHAFRWFKADTTNTIQKIKLPAHLEGNGYVSVTFVRDVNSSEIFMSPLSHGVVPFSVSLDRRRNPLSVSTPDLAAPGEPFTMRVKSEKPSKLVLFAVDEGILQVARYKTPDPLGHFFQKRALEVKTSQILDLILPEFKRLMEAAAPGGDGEAAIGRHLNPFKRRRDKAVAYWSGIIDAGPQERALVYNVPDYFNGTLRVMAVAVSEDAIGVFEKKALVRGDFVLSPNVPTTVAPGDAFEVSVGVANNVLGSGKAAPIALALNTSPHLEVVGGNTIELKIDELREGVAHFKVRAKDMLGSASLQFTASLGDRKVKYAADTSVRPAVPYRVSVAFGSFTSGTQDVPVPRRMYDEYRTLQAGVSYVPLILGHGLVSYLDKNPYGCTEQLVSQALPAIVLQQRPEFGYTRNYSEQALQRIIHMLRGRQSQEGGFGLWAANRYVVPFVSVYAHHFLLEARDRGHAVPADMLKASNEWLQHQATAEGGSLADERARAYAIYLLARQGTVVGQYASALQKRLETAHAKEWKQDLAAAYLASAYQLMRQQRLAEGLIRSVLIGATKAPRFRDYYDDLTRDAQVIYLLARHFPRELKRLDAAALEALVKGIRQGDYNTLSSAYTILALDAYATATGNDAAGKFAISEVLADGKTRSLKLPPGIMPRVAFTPQATKLRIQAGGTYPTYYMVNQSGFDRSLPEKDIKAGLEVYREYLDASGRAITSVGLGDEVEVHLRVRGLGDERLANVVIVDLLPGGFEVVPEATSAPVQEDNEPEEDESERPAPERSVSPIGTAKSNWRPEYADVREDRVVLYGSVDNRAHLFVYRIKATNAGSFAVPPTFAEGMYDRSIQARALGGRIAVEKK